MAAVMYERYLSECQDAMNSWRDKIVAKQNAAWEAVGLVYEAEQALRLGVYQYLEVLMEKTNEDLSVLEANNRRLALGVYSARSNADLAKCEHENAKKDYVQWLRGY